MDQEVSIDRLLEESSHCLCFAMLYLSATTKGMSTSGLWHITTATTMPSFCKQSIEQPSDTSSIKHPFGSTGNHVMTSISRQQIFSGQISQIKSIVCRRMKIDKSSFYFWSWNNSYRDAGCKVRQWKATLKILDEATINLVNWLLLLLQGTFFRPRITRISNRGSKEKLKERKRARPAASRAPTNQPR